MSGVEIEHLPVVGVVEARVLRDGRLRLVLEVRQPSGRVAPLVVEGAGRVPFVLEAGTRTAAPMPSITVEVVPRAADQQVRVDRPVLCSVGELAA